MSSQRKFASFDIYLYGRGREAQTNQAPEHFWLRDDKKEDCPCQTSVDYQFVQMQVQVDVLFEQKYHRGVICKSHTFQVPTEQE